MALCLIALSFLSACSDPKPKSEPKSNKTRQASSPFTYTITQDEKGGYGYNVFENEKCIIKQNIIPALPGNSGFTKREQAEKTADLVIQKLNLGLMPPSLSKEELVGILGGELP